MSEGTKLATSEVEQIRAEARAEAVAETRAAVVAELRFLAASRGHYADPQCRVEGRAATQLSNIIEGTDTGWGWLHSRDWDAFGALSGRPVH